MNETVPDNAYVFTSRIVASLERDVAPRKYKAPTLIKSAVLSAITGDSVTTVSGIVTDNVV